MHCKDCSWWEQNTGSLDFRGCSNVKFWDSVSIPGSSALTNGGYTSMNFGCIHFEEKEQIYTIAARIKQKEKKSLGDFWIDFGNLLEKHGYELLDETIGFKKED